MEEISLFDCTQFVGKKRNYKEPTEQNIKNLKTLVKKLSDYDTHNKPIDLSIVQFMAEELELKMYTLKEKPNCFVFSSEDLFFIWDLNKLEKLKSDDEYEADEVNVVNEDDDDEDGDDEDSDKVDNSKPTRNRKVFQVADPFDGNTTFPGVLMFIHSGSDNVDQMSFNLFLGTNYKVFIMNSYSIASTAQRSISQPNKSKCNIDHSYDNLTCYLLHEIVNVNYPSFTVMNVHGMKSKPEKNIWAINSIGNNPLVRNIKGKSYPILFMLALAQNKKFKCQTNYNWKDYKHSFTGFKRGGPTTSVVGKITNSKRMDGRGVKDLGRYIHSENGITFSNKDTTIKDLIEVHNLTMFYYKNWDNKIHSFEKMPSDITKFHFYFLNNI